MKRIPFLALIMIFLGANLYAADGNLIVNGNIETNDVYLRASGRWASEGLYGYCIRGDSEQGTECYAIPPATCTSEYGNCLCPPGFCHQRFDSKPVAPR